LNQSIEKLVRIAVLETGKKAAWANYIIRNCALQLGIIPSAIQDLYIARGNGRISSTFTTPAINLRTLSYDCARAAFRSARKINSSLMIFEIARIELVWGGMTLAEYSACILAAAIKENYTGPIFLQGDHFQISTSQPLEREKNRIKHLISEAIDSGFYNIDIDTSTMVDLSKPSIDEQQKQNALLSAELAIFTRRNQPKNVAISIGGEIGEVGGHVSTIEELHSYLEQFNIAFSNDCPGQPGLSKVSIHTGTTHGGVVLSDGRIERPTIDFNVIRSLSKVGQENYHLGGVVQHGASTLPLSDFGELVKYGTLEVHLATAFMTTILENLPGHLLDQIHTWIKQNYSNKRSRSMTDSQFYHQFEMFALAPFKHALWNLSNGEKDVITAALEVQFDGIFTALGCSNSRLIVETYIHPVIVSQVFNPEIEAIQGDQTITGLVG
jgi:fructose/tagatose bisphosphate aldolase